MYVYAYVLEYIYICLQKLSKDPEVHYVYVCIHVYLTSCLLRMLSIVVWPAVHDPCQQYLEVKRIGNTISIIIRSDVYTSIYALYTYTHIYVPTE
jgi:hypothetical protein